MWTDWLTPVRLIVRGALLLLICILVMPLTVLCQSSFGRSVKVGRRKLDEFMLNSLNRMICRVFGIKARCAGELLEGPVLIVANHISWLDIVVLHSFAAMSFVAKAEIENWPLFGYLANKGATIYHRRGSHDSASGVVAQMLAKLESGGRVAIFPEGGILPGQEIKRFHARMFKVAVDADCPVQPVMLRYMRNGQRDPEVTFINGENFMVNLGRLLGRPACTAEVSFLEPFAVEQRPRNALADQARAMVLSAYEETGTSR
jgi:1-acyl-sn-glycerol-3-phosphate acyltransferase